MLKKIKKLTCFLGFHFRKEVIDEDRLDFYWLRVTYKCKDCDKLIVKDEL